MYMARELCYNDFTLIRKRGFLHESRNDIRNASNQSYDAVPTLQ